MPSRIGFRYWKDPGPFVQFQGIPGRGGQFLGFWAVLTQAAFSYMGTEIVAVGIGPVPIMTLIILTSMAFHSDLCQQIAAGEAKNPRRNLPKAIQRVYFRILVFYLGGTMIIGLLVPSNDPGLNLKNKNAAASPFVIAMKHAGIRGLPSVSPCVSPWCRAVIRK